MNFIILCVAGTLVQQAGNVRFQLHEVSGHFVVQQDHSRGRQNSSQAALNESSPVPSKNIPFLDKITSIEQTRQDQITVRFRGGATIYTRNLERPDVICFGWKGTLMPLHTNQWEPQLRYPTEQFFKFCADKGIQLFIVSETASALSIRGQLLESRDMFTHNIYGTEQSIITKENFASTLLPTLASGGKLPVVMMVDAARPEGPEPNYMAAQKFFMNVDSLGRAGPGMAYHFMPGQAVFFNAGPVGIGGAPKHTRPQMLYTFLSLNFGEQLRLAYGWIPTPKRKQLEVKESNVITR